MISIQERFVVDERGQRLSVLLDIATYRRLLKNSKNWNHCARMMRPKLPATKPFPLSRPSPKSSKTVDELHRANS